MCHSQASSSSDGSAKSGVKKRLCFMKPNIQGAISDGRTKSCNDDYKLSA